MRKTTSSIRILAVILLLGAWDSSSLQAQDWSLPGAWEHQGRDALGRYEERLQLGADGAFSWTTTFTGRLDVLTGYTPPPVIGAGGEAGVFPFEEGAWSLVQTGSYEVDGNRLRLTGTITEFRVNEESLETFYTRLAEYWLEQEEAERGVALTAAAKADVVRSVVAQAMGETDFEDPRRMRDSRVNTFFLEGRLKRFADFELRSSVKYEVNFQRETFFQEENRIEDWTSVVTAGYDRNVAGLRLRPQVKYMAQWKSDQEEVVQPVFETFFYPILRLDYRLTPQTVLKAGVQGGPLLASVFRDRRNSSRDYQSEDYLVMVTNTSLYSGYELSFNMGYELRKRRMEDRTRQAEDIDYSLFFIRLIAGLRPSEAR
jgi:hypothetical protein